MARIATLVPTLIALAVPGLGQSVLYRFDGDSAGDWFGLVACGAGDVDGDGFDDVVVGAPRDDDGGADAGRVSVFSGFDGGLLHTFDGDAPGDNLGHCVAPAGDVNADGFADLIAGAPLADGNGADSGSARVYSGVDGTPLHTWLGDSAGDLFGTAVSGVGDIDGDGFDDVIVGACRDDDNGTDSGSARVFSGVDGGLLFELRGDSASDWFGFAVGASGDTNGDGIGDLIVGARGDADSEPGWARIYSGADGSPLHTFHGSPGAQLGTSVSGAGDVNGDGYDDVIVGAHQADAGGTHVGRAIVFSGLDGAVLHVFEGDSVEDHFGLSVSGAGDVDGDGFADLIVGALWDDDHGLDSGSARLYSGLDGAVLHRFDGDSAGDSFGRWVSSAGDVNGDGIPDLTVGAYLDDDNGTDSGSVVVLSGCDDCPTLIGSNYCVANPNSSGFPASIAAFGSPVLAENDLTLVTSGVATNQFGYYMMSATQDFVPNFAGSDGNLCLGGKIYRFAKPPTGQVLFSGPDGVLTFSPDLTNLPEKVVFQVGETWNFQSWFRDDPSGFTSNTSDGVSITWE